MANKIKVLVHLAESLMICKLDCAESANIKLHAPFGGMKNDSSHSHERGESAKEFFTSIKTIFMEEKSDLSILTTTRTHV